MQRWQRQDRLGPIMMEYEQNTPTSSLPSMTNTRSHHGQHYHFDANFFTSQGLTTMATVRFQMLASTSRFNAHRQTEKDAINPGRIWV